MAQYKAKKLLWALLDLILTTFAFSSLGPLICGQLAFAQAQAQAQVDEMALTIEALKDDLVGRLARCESGGRPEKGAVITLDANRQAYVGRLQFQVRTVVHYVKELEGRKIDAKEAVQIALDTGTASRLAKRIIFEREGTRNWHNCARRLRLYQEVRAIQKLEK